MLRLAVLAATAGLVAQDPDLAALQRELPTVLDRAAGERIGEPQKARLAALLQPLGDRDLGDLGYARAILLYLERDYAKATTSLDGFFTAGHAIGHDEHRQIAGRIYLASLARAAGEERVDEALLQQRARLAARCYRDLATLHRAVSRLLAADSIRDPAAFRVALLRGACEGDAGPAAVDAFAAELYGGQAPAAPTPRRPAAAPADLRGRAVPEIAATHLLRAAGDGDAAAFTLAGLRGKVLVLDFGATWCPPCRAVTPHLVALQDAHRDELQVVGVTRLYGRGMDFGGTDVELPHGGKAVTGLDEAAELRVNRAFITAFGIDYPVVITGSETAEKFQVSAIPTVFVVGKDGVVRGSVVGANTAELDRLVEAALR